MLACWHSFLLHGCISPVADPTRHVLACVTRWVCTVHFVVKGGAGGGESAGTLGMDRQVGHYDERCICQKRRKAHVRSPTLQSDGRANKRRCSQLRAAALTTASSVSNAALFVPDAVVPFSSCSFFLPSISLHPSSNNLGFSIPSNHPNFIRPSLPQHHEDRCFYRAPGRGLGCRWLRW